MDKQTLKNLWNNQLSCSPSDFLNLLHALEEKSIKLPINGVTLDILNENAGTNKGHLRNNKLIFISGCFFVQS